MRSKLFDSLSELQNLKRMQEAGAVKASDSTQPIKHLQNDTKEDGVSRASKRRRQTCDKLDEGDSFEEVTVQIDEKKHDSSGVVDLCTEAPMSQASSQNHAPIPTPTTVVRLEAKNFALAGKKKKELIDLCVREGIDPTGSDDILKDRIKRFADFWRSECDREIQKPAASVLKEFRDQEAKRAVSVHILNLINVRSFLYPSFVIWLGLTV